MDYEVLKSNLPRWKEEATAGNGIAKYNLAMCYIDGVVIERDDRKAYDLLCEACDILKTKADADNDSREVLGYAYFNRAMCSYYFGDLVSLVYELNQAIKFGYQRAYMYAALVSGGTLTIDQNLLENVKEHYPAGYKTIKGLLLYAGIRGYEKDEQRGLTLLKEAAEMGEKMAANIVINYLKTCYVSKFDESLIDDLQYYINKATNEWAASAIMITSSFFLSHLNIDGAIRSLSFAVDQLNAVPAAIQLVGFWGNKKQKGINVDESQLKKCAELILQTPEVLKKPESGAAAQFLAYCYEKGDLGIEKDLNIALMLYENALSGYEKQLNYLCHTNQGKLYLKSLNFFVRRFVIFSVKRNIKQIKKNINRIKKQLLS